MIGLAASVLSIIASLLCAYRLRNWRHPVVFFGVWSVLLIPMLIRQELAEVDPEPKPTTHEYVGQIVQAYYQRLQDERR